VLGSKLLRTNFTSAEFEPSARLIWTPSNEEAVWAAFTHAVRTPSDAEENFYLSGFTGSFINGLPFMARFNANHNFAPEQLNGYELGYRRLIGRKLSVDIASFYNHYHDLFDQEFAGPVFLEDNPQPPHYLLPARFGNGLLGTAKGVEIAPEWQPFDYLRLRGTYSYLYMNISKAPHSGDIGTATSIVGSSPQHEATVQSFLDISKRLQLDLTYRYVSELRSQMAPSYSTGDARLGWQFNPHLQLSLVGRNLFQPHHVEYGGDPNTLVGVRRSGYLILTWIK
jgi:iron complex outermembrane receptor protein